MKPITSRLLILAVVVLGLTNCKKTEESTERENAQEGTQTMPPTDTDMLEELRKAVREQEERVEERRETLSEIVREKGIIFTGDDSFSRAPESDEVVAARIRHSTFHQLAEEKKSQLESQLESLSKYDSEQLMVYAAGLNIPDNYVRILYPQYFEFQLKIDALIQDGHEESDPTVITHRERMEELSNQLNEAIKSLRATLQAQLDLATDRVKLAESMREETREQAIQRGLDAQEFVEAKKAFKTDQALLQQIRLRLIEETIADKLPVTEDDHPDPRRQ